MKTNKSKDSKDFSIDVECDACLDVVNINHTDVKRRYLKDLQKTHKHYFVCSTCLTEHTLYYTNQKVRKMIKRNDKNREQWLQAKTEEHERVMKAKVDMTDRLIADEMDSIKKKMDKDAE